MGGHVEVTPHGEHGEKMDAMYWLMPIGLFVGFLVVVAFERLMNKSWKASERRALFKSLTKRLDDDLDPALSKKLKEKVDNLSNIVHFWTGADLNEIQSTEGLVKVYEILSLVSALMLSICVTFYTSATKMDHVYGLICCVANCALWMATLSSAFFVVTIGSCESDEQTMLLTNMYGKFLMRVPMILFLLGTAMLFLEFVFFFKMAVDPGFPCAMCLTSCLVIVPLFFHCMHKLGWVGMLVKLDAEVKAREAKYPTTEELRSLLKCYIQSKSDNVMALDFGEFKKMVLSQPIRCTSTQLLYCEKIFDAHVQRHLPKVD